MRLVPFADLSEEQNRAWERLADRAVEPNPFFEPGFAANVAAQIGSRGAGLLIAEGGDGEWIGAMAALPVGKAGLAVALSTWNHDYSFLGTPLVDPAHLDEYANALVGLAGDRRLGRLLVLRDLGDGPVLESLRRALAAAPRVEVAFERGFERAAILDHPGPDYIAHLKSSRRSELRRHRRQLEEALEGEIELDSRGGDPEALDAFLRLEAASWKGKAGTAMACEPATAAFFRHMGEWFGERGRFRMCALEVGDRTVAMICSVTAGDTIFGFKSCFDEELRRFSPGIQLQIADFEAFHERPETRMDSCGEPDNETLNRYWPERRRITTLVIGRRGPVTRAVRAGLDYFYSPAGRRLVARVRERTGKT